MDIGTVVAFRLQKDLPPAERTKFFRELHGYTDKSQYGKYVYERGGFLSDVAHVELARGVIIVRKDDAKKTKSFLRRRAEVHCRDVILTANDKRILCI